MVNGEWFVTIYYYQLPFPEFPQPIDGLNVLEQNLEPKPPALEEVDENQEINENGEVNETQVLCAAATALSTRYPVRFSAEKSSAFQLNSSSGESI